MTHDNDKPTNFAESLALLKQEVKEGQPPQKTPTSLPLKEIKVAHLAFQPRNFEGDRGESEEHIKNLMNAIRNANDHMLEPLLIWWSGKHWYVIDGHHRREAYTRLAEHKNDPLVVPSLPVKVFEGTLQEAISEASGMNSRDKLNMTRNDKLDRAWKMTVMDHPNPPSMSKAQIAKATTISERTVANMRKELKRITEETPEVNPMEMSWDEVKGHSKDKPDYDEKWLEKEARNHAKRLSKVVGMKWARNPTLAAKAIEYYSEKLPIRMLECWREEVEAKVEEWADEDF